MQNEYNTEGSDAILKKIFIMVFSKIRSFLPMLYYKLFAAAKSVIDGIFSQLFGR